MYWSLFLIGAALALASLVGALLPPRYRIGGLLALTAGAGAGVASLAVIVSTMSRNASDDEFWRAFFISSIVGFAVVVAVLVVAWTRAPRAPAPDLVAS
jgi:uncharacterized membrane protein